jgi:hypothetical protein
MRDHCKICGREFPIWFGDPLLDGECAAGGNTLCEEGRMAAHGEAVRRKVCPDAFDEMGKIKPGAIAGVVREMAARGLNPFTGYPAKAQEARRDE